MKHKAKIVVTPSIYSPVEILVSQSVGFWGKPIWVTLTHTNTVEEAVAKANEWLGLCESLENIPPRLREE